MNSEFKNIKITAIVEEVNPTHTVTIDAEGKLKKHANALKTIADAWPIGGLNVRGYATNAPILDSYYTAPPETVPINPAPTTVGWVRVDTVAVNTASRIVILPGPEGLVGAAPVVDLNLYFPIRDLMMVYGGAEPVDPVTGNGNSNEFTLFAEYGTVAGGEANVSGSAATIAITANTQIAGAKSIEATNVQKLHESIFEYLELKSTVGKTHFIFKLKMKAAVQNNKYWFFRLYNGTTVLGSFLFKHGKYGFNANELAVQYISIPIAETPFVDVSYTKATLFFYHGLTTIPGYYIDDVKFLNSLPTIVYADQVQSDWNQLDPNAVNYIKGRFDETLKEDKINKGAANGYAPLDASVKIAATYLDIVNDLLTGGVDKLLSAEQGVVLQGQLNSITSILFSDNVNLDTVQEIVDAIESVQSYLDTILVNDLTTGGVTKALAAEMGVTLKGLIDALTTVVNNKVDKIAGKGLSTEDFTSIEKATLAKFAVPLTQDLIPVSQLDGSIVWQTAPSGGGGALTALTVYVHSVSGNDATAIIGSSSLPFKTVDAALLAIPTDVNRWNVVLVNSATHYVNGILPAKWIRFFSATTATLSWSQNTNIGLLAVSNNFNYIFDMKLGTVSFTPIGNAGGANTCWFYGQFGSFLEMDCATIVVGGTFYLNRWNYINVKARAMSLTGTFCYWIWPVTYIYDCHININKLDCYGASSLVSYGITAGSIPYNVYITLGTVTADTNILICPASAVKTFLYLMGNITVSGASIALFTGGVTEVFYNNITLTGNLSLGINSIHKGKATIVSNTATILFGSGTNELRDFILISAISIQNARPGMQLIMYNSHIELASGKKLLNTSGPQFTYTGTYRQLKAYGFNTVIMAADNELMAYQSVIPIDFVVDIYGTFKTNGILQDNFTAITVVQKLNNSY